MFRILDTGEVFWESFSRVIKLAVNGEPEWLRHEPKGEDFPGENDNAHETTGVVSIGPSSFGDLTEGLDIDHGNSGDYWFLDTQPGHTYRVFVEFGNSPSEDTGGSAWIAFLDPDEVDYASSCCEDDHNRDDGFTFFHVTHSDSWREWNRRYMIKVAAHDLYDKANSAIYNGSYEIFVEDITGAEQMVHSFSGGTTSRTAASLLESGDGNTYDFAMSFSTGSHPAGYILDRVKIQFHYIPAGRTDLSIAIHSDASNSPGATALCHLRTAGIVESAIDWSWTPPHTFLNFNCNDALTASTTYWIVIPNMERFGAAVAVSDRTAVKDYGSG